MRIYKFSDLSEGCGLKLHSCDKGSSGAR